MDLSDAVKELGSTCVAPMLQLGYSFKALSFPWLLPHIMHLKVMRWLVMQWKTAAIDLDPNCTAAGKPYLLFGYSSCDKVDANGVWNLTWRLSPGVFASSLTNQYVVMGSGGCVPGDSGEPAFSPITGRLLGLNVSVSLLHPSVSDFHAARMRACSECNIAPMWFACHVIGRANFLPGGCNAQYF